MFYSINYSLRKRIIEIQVLNLKNIRRCFLVDRLEGNCPL